MSRLYWILSGTGTAAGTGSCAAIKPAPDESAHKPDFKIEKVSDFFRVIRCEFVTGKDSTCNYRLPEARQREQPRRIRLNGREDIAHDHPQSRYCFWRH